MKVSLHKLSYFIGCIVGLIIGIVITAIISLYVFKNYEEEKIRDSALSTIKDIRVCYVSNDYTIFLRQALDEVADLYVHHKIGIYNNPEFIKTVEKEIEKNTYFANEIKNRQQLLMIELKKTKKNN